MTMRIDTETVMAARASVHPRHKHHHLADWKRDVLSDIVRVFCGCGDGLVLSGEDLAAAPVRPFMIGDRVRIRRGAFAGAKFDVVAVGDKNRLELVDTRYGDTLYRFAGEVELVAAARKEEDHVEEVKAEAETSAAPAPGVLTRAAERVSGGELWMFSPGQPVTVGNWHGRVVSRGVDATGEYIMFEALADAEQYRQLVAKVGVDWARERDVAHVESQIAAVASGLLEVETEWLTNRWGPPTVPPPGTMAIRQDGNVCGSALDAFNEVMAPSFPQPVDLAWPVPDGVDSKLYAENRMHVRRRYEAKGETAPLPPGWLPQKTIDPRYAELQRAHVLAELELVDKVAALERRNAELLEQLGATAPPHRRPGVYHTVTLTQKEIEACKASPSAFALLTAETEAAIAEASEREMRQISDRHLSPVIWGRKGAIVPGDFRERDQPSSVASAPGVVPKRRLRPYHDAVLYCQNEED
jgi:hypothetical protein